MIKKYNEYIKESLSNIIYIKNWLDSMNIKNYNINDDLTVDVDGDVNIWDRKLTKIPVKFNKVSGYFNCSDNKLTSLVGCPSVVNVDFYCTYNKLTSLVGCPITVNGNFYCNNNNLISLEGCSSIINEFFSCSNNYNLIDINDLDSKILIKSIEFMQVSQEVYDKYFEYWIGKDFNIFKVLKNKVSDKIKQKYSHLFQANNFDLI